MFKRKYFLFTIKGFCRYKNREIIIKAKNEADACVRFLYIYDNQKYDYYECKEIQIKK